MGTESDISNLETQVVAQVRRSLENLDSVAIRAGSHRNCRRGLRLRVGKRVALGRWNRN
jgi:hypothetical protein